VVAFQFSFALRRLASAMIEARTAVMGETTGGSTGKMSNNGFLKATQAAFFIPQRIY